MRPKSGLTTATSTTDVPPSDTVVIRNKRVARSFDLLLGAVLKRAPGDLADASPVSPVEAEHYRRLVGVRPLRAKYQIRSALRSGGMGRLLYVYDQDFRRHTVMKVILPELKHDATIVRSFIREARITAQLEHPNIVPVHDLGLLPENGIFFTMKYIQGESLHDILQRLELNDPLYLQQYDYLVLLNILRKVCDAVAFAHSRGFVHRDIKPDNIMVGQFGEVLLMDWGLAKTFRRPHDDDQRTPAHLLPLDMHARVVKGSPGYMSPEQAAGLNDRLDPRSDIFLLGATLYHMFTFFPPFLGNTVEEVVEHAHRNEYLAPASLNFADMHIPRGVCHLMQRSMAADPRDRYQNMAEFIRDLDALIHNRMDFDERHFAAGDFLIHEGEVGTECYIIASGEVEVFKHDAHGHRLALGKFGKGDIVGEIALITHARRSANVQALTATDVLVLNEKLFKSNLEKLPPWMARTIQILAERLTRANQMMTQSFHKSELR